MHDADDAIAEEGSLVSNEHELCSFACAVGCADGGHFKTFIGIMDALEGRMFWFIVRSMRAFPRSCSNI